MTSPPQQIKSQPVSQPTPDRSQLDFDLDSWLAGEPMPDGWHWDDEQFAAPPKTTPRVKREQTRPDFKSTYHHCRIAIDAPCFNLKYIGTSTIDNKSIYQCPLCHSLHDRSKEKG